MKRLRVVWSTEREVMAMLLVVLVATIALGIAASRQIGSFADTLHTLDASREVSTQAEDLYARLLGLEIAQRMALITGDATHLDAYDQSVNSVRETHDRLVALLQEQPAYAAYAPAFSELITLRLAELDEMVRQRHAEGFSGAQLAVVDEPGSHLETIRGWLRTLIIDERAQFTEARARVAYRATVFVIVFVVLSLTVLLLTVALYTLVRRNTRSHQRVEQRLKAALRHERELNELKSHFIRTVSHEFRTPLAIIQTSSDMLRRYSDRMSAERRGEHLDKLQEQVFQLTALLEDAVTVQKSQLDDLPYNPERTDMRDLCQKAIATVLAKTPRRHVEFSATSDAFYADVDPQMLAQALTNLIHNALQFTSVDQAVRVELRRTDGSISVAVVDEGTGIRDEDQPRVFDLFFRGSNAADVPGTGLGLAVARSIVARHAGELSFSSTPGEGSTFSIVLPASSAEAVAGAA